MKASAFTLGLTLVSLTNATNAASVAWSSRLYTVNGSYGQYLDTGLFVTTGTQVFAQNVGGGATTFDGINFSAGTVTFNGGVHNGFHDTNVPSPLLSRTGAYGVNGVADTVTLSNLTIGATYRVQALVYDGRGDAGIPGRTVRFDGINQGVYAYGVPNVTWGNGLLVTGNFVADSLSQNFTIEVFTSGGASRGGQLNALLLHQTAAPVAIPETSGMLVTAGLVTLGLGSRRRRPQFS